MLVCEVKPRDDVVKWVANEMNGACDEIFAVVVEYLNLVTTASIIDDMISFDAAIRKDTQVLNVLLWWAKIASATTVSFRKEVPAIRPDIQLVHRVAPKGSPGTVIEYGNTRSISSQILSAIVACGIFPRDCPDEIACVGGTRVLQGKESDKK